MPRLGPRRAAIALRLDDETLKLIDARATAQDVNRSEMIRQLLDMALHRPPGARRTQMQGNYVRHREASNE